MERRRRLSVAPWLRRRITALLRLALLWRRRPPTLLSRRLRLPGLRVRRRARRRVMLRLASGCRLTPALSWRLAVPTRLLGWLACRRSGRLLDRRSARQTEFVGGLVLSSTASADDH